MATQRNPDPDVRALAAACRALEQSTSTRMLHATLAFLWDRYVVHPPAEAWWARYDGKRPRTKRATKKTTR